MPRTLEGWFGVYHANAGRGAGDDAVLQNVHDHGPADASWPANLNASMLPLQISGSLSLRASDDSSMSSESSQPPLGDAGENTAFDSKQPLLDDADDTMNGSSSLSHNVSVSTASASRIKSSFLNMSILFAINHGCSVSCVGLASARLGSIGVWQLGALFASYTATALFGASYVVRKLGSRNGLALGMGMGALYVTSFFVAAVVVGKNAQMVWIQDFVAITGALVGGVGSAILWVSQGAYFSCASQLFAFKFEDGELTVGDVTSQFGGKFAFVFLLFEVILRLLSTIFKLAGLSWVVVLGLYSLLSILPVPFMMSVVDIENYLQRYTCLPQTEGDADVGDNKGLEDRTKKKPCHNSTAALDLLRKDPKAKYMAPVSILFGLSMAFSASVLNGEVIQKVLSDPNSTYVGLYTAITSMVAAVASLLFGRLQSSHNCIHCGKGFVLTIGVLSYLAIALECFFLPDGSDWNWIALLSVYSLLGVSRATFEGTLRALYADFFPSEKVGGFANIILFSGTASTLGYILSVTGALQCTEVSRYCMEYSDGSVHNVLVMEWMIITMAIVAIPSFWRAIFMFRAERNIQVDRM